MREGRAEQGTKLSRTDQRAHNDPQLGAELRQRGNRGGRAVVRPLCCSGGGTPRSRRAWGPAGHEGRTGRRTEWERRADGGGGGASRLVCSHRKEPRLCGSAAEIARLGGREDGNTSSCCWPEPNHKPVGGPGSSSNGSEVSTRQARTSIQPAGAQRVPTHTSRGQALGGDQRHRNSETRSYLIKPSTNTVGRGRRDKPTPENRHAPSARTRRGGRVLRHEHHNLPQATSLTRNTHLHTEHTSAHGTHICT